MGYFYTLGIDFDKKVNAQKCKSLLDNALIKLSNSTEVHFSTYILKTVFNPNRFIISSNPDGMGIPNTNQELFTIPYFYEIRDHIYNLLLKLEIPFNIAFFEFEAADQLASDDVLLEIIESGIGGKGFEDSNALILSKPFQPNFHPKRLFDGLIVSEVNFTKQMQKIKEFKEFKPGYFWLPLKNFEAKNKPDSI